MSCPRSGAALAYALSLASASPLAAQPAATLDVGASAVHYDGYLGSGAFFLSPTVRFDASRLSLGAQGTYLVFESGNRILQGTAAGAWLAPIDRLWRLVALHALADSLRQEVNGDGVRVLSPSSFHWAGQASSPCWAR